jgi:hypothetical protein
MTCHICKNENVIKAGMDTAEQEVIPFFKKDLLNLKYPDHPFPIRFENLTNSCYAFGQLINHLKHVEKGDSVYCYYTANKVFLKYSDQITKQFGIEIKSASQAPDNILEVCEFNIQTS